MSPGSVGRAFDPGGRGGTHGRALSFSHVGGTPSFLGQEPSLLQDERVRDEDFDIERATCVVNSDGDGSTADDIDAARDTARAEPLVQELEQALDLSAIELDQAHAVTRSRSAA